MDASELFSISSRQPARMPPDIKELPPITRGRSSNFPDRVGSPSESPHQSRRKSAGCSMRPVKEERQQAEPEHAPEGSASHANLDFETEAATEHRPHSRQPRSASSARQRTGRHRDAQTPHSGSSSRRSSCNASCGPLPTWDEFFEKCEDIRPLESSDTFRVYSSGSSGPLLFLLHGAGHTSLSWACFTRLLRDGSLPLRVFAYDARGHGATVCADEKNLSAEILTEDGIAIVNFLFNRLIREELPQRTDMQKGPVQDGTARAEPNVHRDPDSLPSVILVGHSMGGAIATRMAASGRVPHLDGLMVLDVVEGTALAALPQMAAFVSRFPSLFTSCKEAVNWSIFAGLLCNRSSAAISIPSQLVKTTRGALPASHKGADKGPPDEEVWTWRVDVMATEPYWEGWFRGMSHAFLSSRCVKILICSSSDRLDKELMIAHMQGKFQVQIVSGSGHVIEEDQPAELCRVVQTFITRYRLHLPPSQRAGLIRG
ncbi:protein phosphatase methylesterase 1, putative [Eimeria tenella]|uniref:protein phosphatase methylesterase-1 n=1 Tax=Eimeria tenella TaxID=5802 RepID=U6KPL4_EIMTE|nr:protein phosphatase methylesterase 1, putative [Eimeria tenella]CDJ38242.1 protein phosphatase methylesterase 1, putative [Eimeria tenella]|eukprot:XP_013229080.1 protein phosphatase methylesterase 1, putative [Eimeria tenella]